MFVFYDWPFPHMCRLLCKECSLFAFLILGSVFSDCVVFYGDTIYVPHFPTSPAHCDNANGLLRRHSGIDMFNVQYCAANKTLLETTSP